MTPVMTQVPAAAPPRVRDRLTGPRRVTGVLHRGADALYVELDGWCLGVVRPPAVSVPCALVVAADAEVDLAHASTVVAGEGELVVDDAVLRVGRFRDVAVPRPGVTDETVAVLRRHAAPALAELGPVTTDDLDTLVGRGSGLTPLGDDVLAGWLATSFALGERPSCDIRGRTTLLSATLVDCAARGEVLPEFARLLRAPDEPSAAALARVGHTSGAGLLLGCALRLEAG